MRFWDSSALVPLLAAEPASEQALELLRQDSELIVWWAARVECVSALRRREREGFMARGDVQRSSELLGDLAAAWSEVLPAHNVRTLAERALAVHPLRAADALQLAAAQAWRRADPGGAPFVCLDERLATPPPARASCPSRRRSRAHSHPGRYGATPSARSASASFRACRTALPMSF